MLNNDADTLLKIPGGFCVRFPVLPLPSVHTLYMLCTRGLRRGFLSSRPGRRHWNAGTGAKQRFALSPWSEDSVSWAFLGHKISRVSSTASSLKVLDFFFVFFLAGGLCIRDHTDPTHVQFPLPSSQHCPNPNPWGHSPGPLVGIK